MKKGLLFLLSLCWLTLPALAFSDVPETHWASREIAQAAEAGVVSGYADGSFRPAGAVTGAQFCAYLTRSFLADSLAPEAEGWEPVMDACAPVLRNTTLEDAYRAAGDRWDDAIHLPLSRNDMAVILYNLLESSGVALPPLEQRLSVQGKIGDWTQIPGRCQLPAATCYCLGLLNGLGDGTFGGSASLSRAQACVIWSRLAALLEEEEPAPETPAFEMPAFGLQGDETVQQMMSRINAKTPRCQEGCLPNGKPRTEENILELLALVKEGCPDGTVWTTVSRYDYRSPSMGAGKGCLAFGMAVSDFVFGEERPLTMNRDFRSLEVGDMIHIKAGGAERVLILTGIDRESGAYTACELIDGDKIDWGGWGPLSEFVDATITAVYSRG